jgi:hypothetical protein
MFCRNRRGLDVVEADSRGADLDQLARDHSGATVFSALFDAGNVEEKDLRA